MLCYNQVSVSFLPIELKRLESQLLEMEKERQRTNEELAYLRRIQTGDKRLIYRSKAMEAITDLINRDDSRIGIVPLFFVVLFYS